ncbi:uncharacterized protein LOC127751145 [Frankliniella occidentalis]|uniref:Uncharacterized protein LOC127751145 n=1 Tax=Frankliniella occidentalis TaxID=133901 RepID=A0A9C6XTR7_FRAOC|nr:uncharacterized protein LOC127751145 [Frankliniella occidentalis]
MFKMTRGLKTTQSVPSDVMEESYVGDLPNLPTIDLPDSEVMPPISTALTPDEHLFGEDYFGEYNKDDDSAETTTNLHDFITDAPEFNYEASEEEQPALILRRNYLFILELLFLLEKVWLLFFLLFSVNISVGLVWEDFCL